MQNPQLGSLTGDFKVNGTGLKPEIANATFSGVISNVTLNNYNYTNIKADGSIANKMYKINASVHDPNLDAKVSAGGAARGSSSPPSSFWQPASSASSSRWIFFQLFFFYEIAVFPIYLLIAIWGWQVTREYAAMKLTLYLFIGSMVALVGGLAMYFASGLAGSAAVPALVRAIRHADRARGRTLRCGHANLHARARAAHAANARAAAQGAVPRPRSRRPHRARWPGHVGASSTASRRKPRPRRAC